MTDKNEELSTEILDNATKAASKKFQDATRLLSIPGELIAQAEKDGYLFFRGLLPTENIVSVRQQILEVFKKRNLLDPSKDLMEGIADYEAINELQDLKFFGVPTDLYLDIYKLEQLHKLAHEPALLDIFRKLFQAEPLPVPFKIARIVLPRNGAKPTPPHQDFIYVQGTPQTWTAWFPLGDCPQELGGISVLEGSHHCGVLDVITNKGTGGLEAILCGLDMEWAVGDYRLGDVIIFNSHTVHKALPNQLGNQIRLSCDFRYQSVNEKIDPMSVVSPLYKLVTNDWEEIYKDWTDDTLKYYWKKHDLTYSNRDESLLMEQEKFC